MKNRMIFKWVELFKKLLTSKDVSRWVSLSSRSKQIYEQ